MLALMCLVSLNLRTVSIGVSPVLPLIREDFVLSYAQAGILFALPIAMMGLCAEPGRRLVDRWGPWWSVAVALALLSLGAGLRAFAPNYATMLLLTAAFGAGIGLAQPSLPRLVALRFPTRRAFATGVYSAGLTGGAVLGAFVTPLALSATGAWSWRGTFLLWAGLAACSLAAWLALGPRGRPKPGDLTPPTPLPCEGRGELVTPGRDASLRGTEPSRGQEAPVPPSFGGKGARGLGSPVPPSFGGKGAGGLGLPAPPVWRDRLAWLIALLFLLQSMAFYQLAGWLPSYYLELGLSAAEWSVPFALFNSASLPTGLLASYFSDRVRQRRPFVAAGALLMLTGVAGLLLAPLDPAWLWPALVGGGIGIVFTLALALPTDLLDPRRAGPTVSLVFTVGYGVALVSPLLAGALRDVLGSFTLTLLLPVAIGLAMLATTAALPETARGLRGPAGG